MECSVCGSEVGGNGTMMPGPLWGTLAFVCNKCRGNGPEVD